MIVCGAGSERHWKELGAPDGFAKWLSAETDLYKRTEEMYAALLDCTPTYEYDIKSDWSHNDKAGALLRKPPSTSSAEYWLQWPLFDFVNLGPEIKPDILDENGRIHPSLIDEIFSPGVSLGRQMLGKYPGVTSQRKPTGWKYGKKMKDMAAKFGMEPDDLRVLLQDESDAGIFEQHVMLAMIVDELGHMTRDEPLVSGEERSSQFEMDEKTSPISPKKIPWPAELLNERYQTAWDKNEEGEVR